MAEMVGPRLYSCCNCRNHVALHDDVISKAFQGRNGRAFLFSHVMNVSTGPKEDKHLMTGLHTVADVNCSDCQEVLGWKYVRAYDRAQKYKEGKFILEKSKIVKENCVIVKSCEIRMGFLSHQVDRSEIKAGDHIYTWKAAFAYSHHGIYVGGNKVVHFTVEENGGFGSGSSLSSGFSSSNPILPVLCLSSPDCGFRKPRSGVVISCLDCFIGTGSLYLFQYGVRTFVFISKLRGGTCTIAKSDPPLEVINRAMHLLQNGFGSYNVVLNNCEDFALYCKTSLLNRYSGQVNNVAAASWTVIVSSTIKKFMCSPVGAVTAAAGMHCWTRYINDIGVRGDVVKVKVEDMASVRGHVKKSIVEDENHDGKETYTSCI